MPTDRKLAVVTGASSGIGLELAKRFAENDFDLIVTAEDDAVHTAAQELSRLGAQVDAVQVDLATDEGVDRSCTARWRSPDRARTTEARSVPAAAPPNEVDGKPRHVP